MKPSDFRRALILVLFAAAAARGQSLRVDLDSRLELAGVVDRLATVLSTSTPDALAGSAYVRELTGRVPAPADPELRVPRPTQDRAEEARLMLSLSPIPRLERLDAAEFSDIERAGGADAVERRLAALRDFAAAAKFDAAFDASRYLLDPDAARLRKRLLTAAPVQAFEAYTGLGQPGRTLVLISPFQPAGPAPGYVKVLKDGSVSLTVVVGPVASTSAPTGLDFWSDRLPEAIWNELAQRNLEPLAELYSGRIAQSSRLASLPGWSCKRDWPRCVEDQIARAIVLRLTAKRSGADAAKARQKILEGGEASPMLEALLEKLQHYEKSRLHGQTRGAGLADYYPELLSALPLDDPKEIPAPPALPDASTLSPSRRRRLAAFLKSAAPRTRDPRLKSLASASAAWAAAAAAPAANDAAPVAVSSAAASNDPFRRGIEEFSAGRGQAALDDFTAALSSAPRDAQILASKAAVLSSMGRDDEALAAYAAALESARAEGDSSASLAADILSSRATVEERLKRPAGAISDLEQALRDAPPEWTRRDDAKRRLKALKARARRGP